MEQNQHEIVLEQLLADNHQLEPQNRLETDLWDAGFDVNRQLIFSKLPFYEKVFLRPEKYVRRFYHTIYPLLIEEWELIEQLQLYDGFCTMNIELAVRFQATLRYIENNLDFLDDINEQIKSAYQHPILSVVYNELNDISDGLWIKNGLGEVEKKIGLLIAETLVLHNIQAQALCSLKPHFKEFPQVQLTKENLHLSILKKDFELENKYQQELYRQEIEAEKSKQQQKQRQLEQLDRDLEIERRKLVLEAEHKRLILVEQEGFQIDYFAIEERLSTEKMAHENRLETISLEANSKKQQHQREIEQTEQLEILAHQQQVNEKKLAADIVSYEQQQHRWIEVKERVYVQKLALIKKQQQLKNT
jgi:hypothetical protein